MCFIPTGVELHTTETRLAVIETRLGHIERHYATKADLWKLGVGLLLAQAGVMAVLLRLMGPGV